MRSHTSSLLVLFLGDKKTFSMNANRRLKIQTSVALVERILTETNASAVNIQRFLSFFLVVDNRMRKKNGVKTTSIEAARQRHQFTSSILCLRLCVSTASVTNAI
jgi:hypothetical protein